MSGVREVRTLPISQDLINKLITSGFRFIRDIFDMQPLDLAKELSIRNEEAFEILEVVKNNYVSQDSSNVEAVAPSSSSIKQVLTAKDLIQKMTSNKSIITFCRAIDVMMDGGVPIGQITEFCGVPGNHYTPFE